MILLIKSTKQQQKEGIARDLVVYDQITNQQHDCAYFLYLLHALPRHHPSPKPVFLLGENTDNLLLCSICVKWTLILQSSYESMWHISDPCLNNSNNNNDTFFQAVIWLHNIPYSIIIQYCYQQIIAFCKAIGADSIFQFLDIFTYFFFFKQYYLYPRTENE